MKHSNDGFPFYHVVHRMQRGCETGVVWEYPEEFADVVSIIVRRGAAWADELAHLRSSVDIRSWNARARKRNDQSGGFAKLCGGQGIQNENGIAGQY